MPRRLLVVTARLPRPPARRRAGRRQPRAPGRPRRLAAALGVGHVELAPFDEARLYAPARHRPKAVAAWLDDRRTLGQFAARRGYRDQGALAEKLVAPRLRTASAAMKRTLRQRSRDMLSQAHLARHVLFHIYHTPAIPRHAQEIFGMSPQRYRALRDSGTTPMTIAARGGRTLDGVARRAAHDPRQARRPGRARRRDEHAARRRRCSPSRRPASTPTCAATTARRPSRSRSSAACRRGRSRVARGARYPRECAHTNLENEETRHEHRRDRTNRHLERRSDALAGRVRRQASRHLHRARPVQRVRGHARGRR